jgi:signal transduction histidine kinase
MILSQTARLAQICREVSDFTTSRPAETELRDVNALIRSTTSLMRYDKRVRRIALELDLDSQLPAVNCVGDQVIQVIMNLVINAADALEKTVGAAPRITVKTAATAKRVCIAVADNGCGMDAQTLQHATEAFFTTKSEGRGSGLGLALCKSIAESHNGALEIDSEVGVGTEVRFLLPLATE